MRTKILPERALDVIKRNAIAYTALRKVRMGVGRFVPPRRVAGVTGRVHFNDFMFTSDADAQQWYVGGAENVIGLIDRSLEAAGRSFDELRGVLDFGCGYGRVIRLLVRRIDPSRVYATDVIREAIDYCASEFGVNPVYSRGDGAPRRLPPMDLVYAVSVLTHVPERYGRELLRSWGDSIEPGGVLLFTTHGPTSFSNLERYGRAPAARRAELEEVFRASGFVYEPYPHHLGDDYGLAWHTRDYLESVAAEELPGFTQLWYEPAGLDGHQDVYAYQRSSEAAGVSAV
jgi:SAM-dependent methyltransferase